jgi:hypothetical protein
MTRFGSGTCWTQCAKRSLSWKAEPSKICDAIECFSSLSEIEIIGEAASRISDETRQSLPAIPWPKIVGIRNRLIHAYADRDKRPSRTPPGTRKRT